MDEVDLKILRILQDRPQVSMTDLARKVGLSHTPCWRRVKRLEENGAIQDRAIILNQAVMGLNVNVLATVKLKAHDEDTLEAFEQATRDRPEIVECFTTGGESDYSIRIVVRSIDEHEHLLKKVLLHFPGVGSMQSHFALKCVKMTTKLPI
jgi:Lrp/AsnC family transcriptional regulator